MSTLDSEFEKAIRMLVAHMPPSDETSRKPALPHALLVGTYLYIRNYSRDSIIAGLRRAMPSVAHKYSAENWKRRGGLHLLLTEE